MATALAVLDAVRARDDVPGGAARVVGRISFFLNAGIRFVEEICKVRAMGELWDDLHPRALRRRGRQAATPPLRRAGEQPGPHRGPAREQRDSHRPRGARRVTLSKKASAPRPAAARLERGARPAAPLGPAVVAAHPADPGLRDRPARVRGHLRRLARRRGPDPRAPGGRARSRDGEGARHGRRRRGGRERLHEAAAGRVAHASAPAPSRAAISRSSASTPTPKTEAVAADRRRGSAILRVDESAEREQIERLEAFRSRRNTAEAEAALRNLTDVVKAGGNVMPPSIRAAHAGVTTGEWADALRALFGEYRAPTGVVVRKLDTSGPRRARCASASTPCRSSSGDRSRSWSASPASTATATAPSRSP